MEVYEQAEWGMRSLSRWDALCWSIPLMTCLRGRVDIGGVGLLECALGLCLGALTIGIFNDYHREVNDALERRGFVVRTLWKTRSNLWKTLWKTHTLLRSKRAAAHRHLVSTNERMRVPGKRYTGLSERREGSTFRRTERASPRTESEGASATTE